LPSRAAQIPLRSGRDEAGKINSIQGGVLMAKTALQALGTSVFSEMTALALKHGAVNLSQGFPDFEGPADVVDDAVAALKAGHNQYGRSLGVLPLVQAIARHSKRFYDVDVDPLTEVVCTAGATEALAAAMIGLLDAGDEVIVMEPFYDGYPATIAMSGAVPVVVTLRWPDFALDVDAIARSITSKTRMIVVNNPHNPTGKVFTVDELDAIAGLCVQHDLIAVCDEVYEHITFDVPHVPLCTRPGMRERTLTLSSTGKTFSFTGWKVGWATGPAPLVAAAQRAHQFLTFCASTPLHVAMASALDRCDEAFVERLQLEYVERRDFVVGMLREVGFEVSVPAGAYFCLASMPGVVDDRAFARELVSQAKVAAIPPSAFYSVAVDEGRRLLRFAFCKKQLTLDDAADRLRRWKGLPAAPRPGRSDPRYQ
jgi:N-succinyldiaminopimelate aminotransferase